MRFWKSLLSVLTILLFCLSITTMAFAKGGGGGGGGGGNGNSAASKGNSNAAPGSAAKNTGSSAMKSGSASQTGDPAQTGDASGKVKGPKSLRDGEAHPSQKGLQRAYSNIVANGASPRAQEALRTLIDSRGGAVPDTGDDSTTPGDGTDTTTPGTGTDTNTPTTGTATPSTPPSESEVIADASNLDTIANDPQTISALTADATVKSDLTAIAQSTFNDVRTLSKKEAKSKAFKQVGNFFAEINEPVKAVQSLEQAALVEPADNTVYKQINEVLKETGPKNYTFYLNGKKPSFDTPPVVENNRLLIPLRSVSESLGATVQWNPETKTATITKDGREIVLKAGDTTASVDGKTVSLEAPGKIGNGNRMIVPLRFISETLKNEVSYYPESQLVVIK
ncbi:hypothetical protein GTO91_05795 [Heliobacterium undosum]|uniref:Copper amine oxidase-like N-terminal domain-containing protein n=1 Tax=Heliomicrobium undosum TaxID=121734 RepID=A0A845KYZ8_9FIRM|nr:copper amine oxidase N-terminal domain-containing protein [Heliomicrobium undosum]MZP29217.1 hypothetical protein [Heliomicrobium undosum]